MFQNLTNKLSTVFDGLNRRGTLSEEDVNKALREVRLALLEADVSLPIAKQFIDQVKEKAIGQEIVKSISPAQMVIKLVHDQLVELLGAETAELSLNTQPPAVILMAGLQGGGKTTASAKLARWLIQKKNKKVLVASLDIYRPAAQEQLAILAKQINTPSLEVVPGQSPADITKRALKLAKAEGYDVLILDTAGRTHIDESMMQEAQEIHEISKPIETFLVVDSMTGQDAVNSAKSFNAALPLTGIILTRVDGDSRGGAALSMKLATGCPIKFIGLGEKIDQFDVFHPERIAGRILDKGDVVSLVEQAAESFDEAAAEKLSKKMAKGKFDLNDLASQLRQMQKMGGMGKLMSMIPGINKMKDKLGSAGLEEKSIAHQIALIQSMTPQERRYPKLLNASRKRRVAQGSGLDVPLINKLLKQHEGMGKMMKKMKKMKKSDLAALESKMGQLPNSPFNQ
ncbi:MAG: signal recognition particle protein [Alphaproteobacteria bacterium]|nr:MAG: signal recognition particle protein [Alphaproteobacteria bacterium]